MRRSFALVLVIAVTGCGRLGFDPSLGDGTVTDSSAMDSGRRDSTVGDSGGSEDSGAVVDARPDGSSTDAMVDGATIPPDPCADSVGREVFCVPDMGIGACCGRTATSVFDAIDQFVDTSGGPLLVLVRSGDYPSQPRIVREAVIFRGIDDGGGRPLLQGSNAPVFNLRRNEVTIEGFEIRGVTGGGPALISIIQDDPTPLAFRGQIVIRDNVLSSPGESGIYFGLAAVPTELRDVTVVDNIIENTPRFTLFMAGITGMTGVRVNDNCFLPPSGLDVEVPYVDVDMTDNYWGIAGGPGPAGVGYTGPAPVLPARDSCHVR